MRPPPVQQSRLAQPRRRMFPVSTETQVSKYVLAVLFGVVLVIVLVAMCG